MNELPITFYRPHCSYAFLPNNMKTIIYIAVVVFIAITSSQSVVSGSNMIMDVLNAHSDRFSMLIQSLQTAGLADTLQKG